MRSLLRLEYWIIQKFKFDRMTNNLFWLIAVLFPFILALLSWLLLLHDIPNTKFIINRDPAYHGKVAEIYYQDQVFYLRPLIKGLLLNFKLISETTQIQEEDQVVIGHTIFQVRQLDGWTPHLRTVGYYATNRDLSAGVAIGRSIHPEELNNWEVNDIIVKDSSFEPVHFLIVPAGKRQYRIKNVSKKGLFIPYVPPQDEQTSKPGTREKPQDLPAWAHVKTETIIQAGQQIKIESSIFELIPIEFQEALAFKIVQGVRPTYTLSREAHNVIGGLGMIPRDYIPDYLIDEEFLEYVRQAIEHDLFSLEEATNREGIPILRVKGFDVSGKLVKHEFDQLSVKENFLLHQIFRFWEREGATLRWRRPFNREAEDKYAFYPDQLENFSIDPNTNQVKNIYQYAALLTNPHTIADEVATERGEIYDRDQHSLARLWMYPEASPAPIAELLLVPSDDPNTMLAFDTKKSPDNIIYVAGGYRFSEGTSVVYEHGQFQKITGDAKLPLRAGDRFTVGQYTFQYAAPGKGLLAQNIKAGNSTQRDYPLGSRLAHIVGYSYAKSQFKGNIEKVFDNVLLGQEKQKPWWSLERTITRTPGNNLILTIDDDFERVVFAELKKKLDELNKRYNTSVFSGAAIVINAQGEILASATIPSYNPNDIRSILAALAESEEDHWNSKYINRATHKSYPPGSTMKVIMSTLVLDNKEQFLRDIGGGQYLIKDGSRNFACTGLLSSFRGVSFGKYSIPDFGGSAHGELTLDTALTRSCNNTFAFLALNAGWEMIQKYAERYGFNIQFDFLPYQMFKSDIQLVSNINREWNDPLASLKSQVPTPKDELKLTQLARMGIGQWEILATPLQMATVAMTVGNLGLRPYPHIVKGIEDRTKNSIRYFDYPKQERVLPAEILAELFPMMQHVVQIGSGVRMVRSTIPYYALKDHVAGKTGTAEVEDESGRKYNVVWFISFVPVENPQMALAVVIEKGPIISGEAVEIARGIWEKAVLLYPEVFGITKGNK